MAHVRESSQGLDEIQTNWGGLDGSEDGDSAWLQVGRRVWEKGGGIGGCAGFYDGGCGGPGQQPMTSEQSLCGVQAPLRGLSDIPHLPHISHCQILCL